jgi:hypothetical protein
VVDAARLPERGVLTLLDPMEDPLGAGYHIIQSTIAIGSAASSARVAERHPGAARLPCRSAPPTSSSRFRRGVRLAGNVVLIVALPAHHRARLMIAANASTVFARLAAGAITLTFFTYAFVNMGMVSGILPVVGVPLPMISYGGTALLSILSGSASSCRSRRTSNWCRVEASSVARGRDGWTCVLLRGVSRPRHAQEVRRSGTVPSTTRRRPPSVPDNLAHSRRGAARRAVPQVREPPVHGVRPHATCRW